MSAQPISEARLAANRANGVKSNGPKTPEGKAAVAGNAIKHGLRSERNPLDLATETTLPFEHEEFLSTLEILKEDLCPLDALETRLVERLALLDLRLTRAARMEMTHLDISARQVFQKSANALPDEEPARKNWLTTLAFLHSPNAMDLISRYESRLTRDFAKTLTQFRQAQKSRIQTQHATTCQGTEEPVSIRAKENSTEQIQPPNPGIPTRSHASNGVGINEAAQPREIAEQTHSAAPVQRIEPLPKDESAPAEHQNTARSTGKQAA